MKHVMLLLLCVAMTACASMRQVSAKRVLRRVDAALSHERTADGLERRLAELGAKIEPGAVAGEHVATFPAPGNPGYFPPRIVRIVYSVTPDGVVELQSADILSFGSKLG